MLLNREKSHSLNLHIEKLKEKCQLTDEERD